MCWVCIYIYCIYKTGPGSGPADVYIHTNSKDIHAETIGITHSRPNCLNHEMQSVNTTVVPFFGWCFFSSSPPSILSHLFKNKKNKEKEDPLSGACVLLVYLFIFFLFLLPSLLLDGNLWWWCVIEYTTTISPPSAFYWYHWSFQVERWSLPVYS